MPTPPRMITFDGETLPLKEWAARTGLTVETIRSRLDHQGWDVARALTTHAEEKFSKHTRRPVPVPRAVPPMRHHKGTGRAYASWQHRGKRHSRYFGPWGSPEAGVGYRRFSLEWLAGGVPKASPSQTVFVAELIEDHLDHVERNHVKFGRPTSEVNAQKAAARVLNDLFGHTPAGEFGPARLRECRDSMVAKGWARKSINQHAWRITRCFQWGVGEGMVPPDVYGRLKAVEPLKAGRTAAPERPKVKPAPDADIEAVVPHLSDHPARRAVLETMIRFHLVTGMRPGELCGMRVGDVDTAGDVWMYDVPPELNKNEHREQRHRYWIGPRGRAILGPRIADPGPGGRLWWFPPRGENGKRRTPVSRGAYGEAVRMACDAAGVKRWHPHQLRHNRATEVQRRYESDEAAAAAIGDTPEVVRAVYVDPSDKVSRRIAREMG